MEVEKIMQDLQRKHPGEQEYLQAVHEVLISVKDVYNQHPEFEQAKIVERLVKSSKGSLSRRESSLSGCLGLTTRARSMSISATESSSTALLVPIREGFGSIRQSTCPYSNSSDLSRLSKML